MSENFYDYDNTIKRAKENNVTYIWSGDLARNGYLRRCLNHAKEHNLVKLTMVEMDQETGYDVEWL